ncbi:thioredoxin-disulfide reductase [Eubacterium ventriosum]|jgi:thioredoxin-disulfide reductase|uniref:Thioredoxin reductase n=1 Tax=Eubacterium ventriosum TaxID=39496 RepID=A0A413RBT8_9FIRM|nr:thioredoxin-disulfide reductase [Eubacterium ventriosum]MEE0853738.1 thioredoxin-disulfide reductase [Eubacterium ventriosum]RHA20112.1 thioredoxin-disulfide reductase [Eubacterium ventriosum]RHB17899.1 thioredoxin-disulfide reductase [Eubacterium ventriosum]
MYDIVIVGAGTAGMSAAIYGVRSGKKVLLLEEKNYGGQIVNTPEVENYPGIIKTSGFEFATNLFNQAKSLGAEIKYEKALKIEDNGTLKTIVTNKNTYEAKTVIIATGAKNRQLRLENEKKLIGSGVSYCATCDGMFFRGRDVAVVGGGNTALEDAMFLSNYCNKVYIIHRRDKLRGEEKIAKAISEKDNIEMVWNSNVIKILGDNQVEGITVKNSVDGSEKNIKVSGLFIAVGQEPDNYDFQSVIKLDEKGYVIAGEDCRTETNGIFTAGDCRTKSVRQLTTAASDGAVAAIGACEYIDTQLKE